ncbi:MAG: hypothetical protein JWP08_1407 [Bryobacterales bacterium]|nr:hypothetical protein [Bryobacterales bacterium]
MRIYLLQAFFCLPLLCADPQASPTHYTIAYTGRTLGYYRTPDLQPVSVSTACPSGNEELAQVQAFQKQVASIAGPKILLAAGDNFGPELEARSLCNERGQLIPKERSRWTGSDNVGTFFRTLGFNAIVPGRLDFHYGPERLHQIARYLASHDAPGSPVQMLASNLTIETTIAHPPAETPAPTLPQNYSVITALGTKFHLPKMILPFIRQFDIEEGASVSTSVTTASGAVQTQALRSRDLNTAGQQGEPQARYKYAWLCPGELGPRFELPSACRPLVVDAPNGTTLTVRMPEDWPIYPGTSSILQSGTAAYVCASAVASLGQITGGNTLCSGTFQPQIPYLQSGDHPASNPKPYAAIGETATVIFGVVDPALLTEVGELHSTWRNRDPAFDTRLQVGDPLEALLQVLQTCDADPDCRGKRRVLLAQVPLSKAQRIAVQLRGRFDAVVSQADGDSATRDTTITDRFDTSALAPVVLVPAPNYSSSDQKHLAVTTQEASFSFAAGSRTVENRIDQADVALLEKPFTGVTPLWKLMVSAGLAPAPDKNLAPGQAPDYKGVVLNSILGVMRRSCKADVAFLQHRDLFIPVSYAFEQPDPAQLQELLDRLLWKGDLVICRPLSGRLLAGMKADSDRYDSEDQDPLSEHVAYGRGLDYLGMFQNGGDLTIGGATVSPGNLYSVATTDYLGVGDTGYAALHDPSVPAPARLAETKELDEVSALVCDAIADGLPENERGQTSCRKPADPQTYFDGITMAPACIPSGLTWREKLAAWAEQNWATRDIFGYTRTNRAELQAQNKRVLSLRLDRADAGLLQNLHSLSESQQRNRFSGVQAPEPTAPEKLDATLDWLLRLTSSGKNIDRFVQTDAQYEASAIRQMFLTTVNGVTTAVPSEPYQLSQPRNSVGIEAGLTTHLIPAHQKNVTGLKLLTSARFETQLASPFIQFQARDGFLNENLPRNNNFFGKVGLRYDGVKSWLETGLQSGPFTQVSSLKLGPLTCDPGNITNCASPDGGATILSLQQLNGREFSVQSSQRIQSGIFFNARIHVPILIKRFDYVIENSGTLYFNRAGDSPADTRYLEVMTHSLSIPVVGNLSIVPRFELFLFQNKVAGWHIHGYQTSVTAQYRFDWRTGLHWGQALRYPNPPQSNNH